MPIVQQNDIVGDRYILKESICSRGTSEIWKAEDWKAAGAVKAVRIYAPNGKLDKITQKQLASDYSAIMAMQHPHLVPVEHFDVAQDIAYAITPYYEKGSLKKKLVDEGPCKENEIALLLQQIGGALKYLHAQKPAVVHQAVKPENILLAGEGNYLLADYGVSNSTRSALQASGQGYTSAMAYAPPERFTAQPSIMPAGDIFSLGVAIYELCTGEQAWMGSGGICLLKGAEIPYLPGPYSRVLSNIIRACLSPDPEKRPTAAELEAEGTYFIENGTWKQYGKFGIVKAEVIDYKKHSSLKTISLAAVLIIALLAGSYAWYTLMPLQGNEQASLVASVIPKQKGMEAQPKEEVETQSEVVEPAAEALPKQQAPEQEEAGQKIVEENDATQVQQTAKRTVNRRTPTTSITKAIDKKPSYPRPVSLDSYLSELPNDEIPLEIREQWRAQIVKYFNPDALIYYSNNQVKVGTFSVNEIIDILLSTDSTTMVYIDRMQEGDNGKVAELYLQAVAKQP